MAQMSIYDTEKKLNISQIPCEPSHSYKRCNLKDYKVKMEEVVKEPAIKKWIEKDNFGDELRKKMLNSDTSPYIRVRHDDDGNITEMNIFENGIGHLCCMCYSDSESWPRLIKMIEKANEVKK